MTGLYLTHLGSEILLALKIFLQKMKQVMSGLKNTSATSRGHPGIRLREGKEPLLFEMYCTLHKWLQEDGSNESHCFLTLIWNLIHRSKNTVFFQWDKHIGWSGDAMRFN